MYLQNSVKEVLTDFESALWAAVADVMPQVKHHGCCFHWKQTVLRMVRIHFNFDKKPIELIFNRYIFRLKILALGLFTCKKEARFAKQLSFFYAFLCYQKKKLPGYFSTSERLHPWKLRASKDFSHTLIGRG